MLAKYLFFLTQGLFIHSIMCAIFFCLSSCYSLFYSISPNFFFFSYAATSIIWWATGEYCYPEINHPTPPTGNVNADSYESHLRGPSFVMEPPSRLDFSNSSGGWLDCSASGTPHPTIDWISMDSTSVGDVSGVRRVLRNGTLVLLPFSAAAYRQDIHNTIYRCVASNSVGRIISRDVQVRAGE